MPNLQSLRLDITIQQDENPPLPHKQDEIVVAALQPMKDVNAKLFMVEMNVEPSQGVWDRLGNVNFTVAVREREQNVEVYGGYTPLVIGD
jgi:hypothetical protein